MSPVRIDNIVVRSQSKASDSFAVSSREREALPARSRARHGDESGLVLSADDAAFSSRSLSNSATVTERLPIPAENEDTSAVTSREARPQAGDSATRTRQSQDDRTVELGRSATLAKQFSGSENAEPRETGESGLRSGGQDGIGQTAGFELGRAAERSRDRESLDSDQLGEAARRAKAAFDGEVADEVPAADLAGEQRSVDAVGEVRASVEVGTDDTVRRESGAERQAEAGRSLTDAESKVSGEEEDAGGVGDVKPGSETRESVTGEQLTEEEVEELKKLEQRDAEIRAHERAHQDAGGTLVRGGASFKFELGPDGRRYAVSGEVDIDAQSVKGDPEATIRKMERVKRASLAPRRPSAADRRAAALADRRMAEARRELERRDVDRQRESVGSRAESSNEPEIVGVDPDELISTANKDSFGRDFLQTVVGLKSDEDPVDTFS